MCVIMCVMRTVTVREAQHHLARVLEMIDDGEPVEIVRRNKPVARLVPIQSDAESGRPVSWAGHAERMRELWRGQSVSVMDEVLDDLRDEP